MQLLLISLLCINYIRSTLFILIKFPLHTSHIRSISNNTVGVSTLWFPYCLSHFTQQTVLSQFRLRPKIYLCHITSGFASSYVGILEITYCFAFPAVSSKHSNVIQLIYVIIIIIIIVNKPLNLLLHLLLLLHSSFTL